MADLPTYLVLGFIIVPPILRQAKRRASSVQTPRPIDPSQPPPPKLLSRQRLTPFSTPFTAAVSIASILLVLISLRNLVPVQYGFDIFIPSSVIDKLRKSIYTLYTAPSVFQPEDGIDNVPLHIEAFRGGYKPDLFLAYKAPITIPTTTLRDLINATPSLLPIGYLTPVKQAELQALIARLSSYERRRTYLLLGPAPLLDCTFCKNASDHFWYALPFLFAGYAWRILALGLLTTHPHDSVAVAIRQLGALFGFSSPPPPQTQAPQANAKEHEADRSGWRTPSVTVLLGLLVVEMLIMFEFGQVTAGSSRLNHWHTNLHIIRQLVFLALVLTVYLQPAPKVVGSFEQSMLHLAATQQSLQNLMHVSELDDITRAVVLQDDQLLQMSRQWRSSSDSRAGPDMGAKKASSIIQAVAQQEGQTATAGIAQAREGIRRATRLWWQNAEVVNQQADDKERHFDQATTARSGKSPAPSTAIESASARSPSSNTANKVE
ncbi:uncharacterized protein UDID_05593 [Ustilago sp. UG-2017a]|nr:uncharacterized protein UDID_05593 [Ustilago sp. UG-2017a]